MSDHVELSRPAGHIKVSPSAIAGIASAAVLQCYGVVGIAGKRIRGGRARVLDEDHYEQGIAVTMDSATVTIDVYVVVEYGTRISEVAHNIINAVGAAARRTLGDVPVHVNVNVQGLRISA
jgi:uncharacterized alkaline shock family protein YloU